MRTIKLYKFLTERKKEFILSKQVLRCGTSIGANVREAVVAQSKADFYAKLHISLKEANETEYWLELLYESGYIDEKSFTSIYSDNKELLKQKAMAIKNYQSELPTATTQN